MSDDTKPLADEAAASKPGASKSASKGKRARGGSSAPPTMRLVTLQNCDLPEAVFGVEPLTTTPAMATPIEHSVYELTELPTFEARGPPRGMPWEEDDATFLRFRQQLPLEVTPQVIYDHVAKPSLALPLDAEQRTEGWHAARSFAVTASQFASASNENPTMSANKLLTAKTYPKASGFAGNAFTEWGTIHEKHAEEAFVTFLSKSLGKVANKDASNGDITFEDGSVLAHISHKRDPALPFLGFSPDALLWNKEKTEVSLVEYKCPAYQRSGPGHPYAAKNELCVPRQYMPQLQGSMLLLRKCYPEVACKRAWFIVWQAHQFFVTHVPYVPRFAEKIVADSTTFFKDRFLPACAEAVSLRDGILCASLKETIVTPAIHLHAWLKNGRLLSEPSN